MRKINLVFTYMLVFISQTYCEATSSHDVKIEEFLNQYNNTVSAIGFCKSIHFK